MPDSDVIVQLPPEAVTRLPSAIARLVPALTTRFQAALELGYLAASADGLDDRERKTIATALSSVTGIGYDQAAFARHFADLDDAVSALGRRERLARTAAELENDGERENAIRFATLIAMADGTLHETEAVVLDEAATHFQWTEGRVRGLVTDTAAKLRGER